MSRSIAKSLAKIAKDFPETMMEIITKCAPIAIHFYVFAES